MEIPVPVIWAAAGLLSVLSLFLLAGKGGFLLAGYNTADPEEREQYHEKRLCRVTGGGMGVLAVQIALLAAFEGEPPPGLRWVTSWGILVVVVATVVLSNTVCRRRQ